MWKRSVVLVLVLTVRAPEGIAQDGPISREFKVIDSASVVTPQRLLESVGLSSLPDLIALLLTTEESSLGARSTGSLVIAISAPPYGEYRLSTELPRPLQDIPILRGYEFIGTVRPSADTPKSNAPLDQTAMIDTSLARVPATNGLVSTLMQVGWSVYQQQHSNGPEEIDTPYPILCRDRQLLVIGARGGEIDNSGRIRLYLYLPGFSVLCSGDYKR